MTPGQEEEVMTKLVLYLTGIILIAIIVIGVSGCDSITGPADSDVPLGSQTTGIWVTGEGEVTVVPDLAILSLGVEAEADTVAKAQSEAATAMNNIVSELNTQGIESNDIQTQHFSIYPTRKWDPDTGEEELTGYQVTNMVTVKVREVEDTGTIIDAVAAAGGNYIRINSIEFTVDDPAPYQKEARDMALADAREKAEQIADSTDVKLGVPTYIAESSSYEPYVTEFSMAIPAPTIITESGSSISPGEMTVTVIMQVAYDID
jgi:uncharacterized protein YggE